MGDLEEALSRKYYIVDTWTVMHQHVLIILSSALIFTAYGFFLWLLCSLTPSVLTVILLLGTQVGLGLPLTRTYYELGITAAGMLQLNDPVLPKTNDEIYDLKIKIGDLPLIFEKLSLQVRSVDAASSDDLSDISWFLIIVWAIISAGAHYVNIINISFCIFGTFVLLASCLISYISGYKTKRGVTFEEDLYQLEYYIETFIRKMDVSSSTIKEMIVLRLNDRRRSSMLIDIVIEFIIKNIITLEYHFGLSSHIKERFVMEAPSEQIASLLQKLHKKPLFFDLGWGIERVPIQSGEIIRICNQTKRLSISNRSSFITNLAVIEKNSEEAGKILSSIIDDINETK